MGSTGQPAGADLASAIPRPHYQAEYEELVLAVHRAVLTKLPRPLREIVDRVLQDQNQAQIGEELHVNPVTVRTRLTRARWILRRELAAYMSYCRPRAGYYAITTAVTEFLRTAIPRNRLRLFLFLVPRGDPLIEFAVKAAPGQILFSVDTQKWTPVDI